MPCSQRPARDGFPQQPPDIAEFGMQNSEFRVRSSKAGSALYQFDKLQLHIPVGFDSAQPTFLERSRWRSLPVGNKEDLSSCFRELL